MRRRCTNHGGRRHYAHRVYLPWWERHCAHRGVYLPWWGGYCAHRGVPTRVGRVVYIPRYASLPTLGGIYPGIPPYPTIPPWVHPCIPPCTGVPGHDVHRAPCPGGEALGSNLRLIIEKRQGESLRTLRVLTFIDPSAQSYSVSPGINVSKIG